MKGAAEEPLSTLRLIDVSTAGTGEGTALGVSPLEGTLVGTPAVERRPLLLIVEDDTFWRRWYVEHLSGQYQLRFAGDARTALQRVATYRPAAIICDRHINPIPRLASPAEEAVAGIDRELAAKSYVDGWQFLRQLRKSVFREIPVVLVTDDGPGGMNWVRQKVLQPDGFITKGRVSSGELLALLASLLRRWSLD